MITEQRLLELIEQEAIIYRTYENGEILPIKLRKEMEIRKAKDKDDFDIVICMCEECKGKQWTRLENYLSCFENEEDAEFETKYSNIERIETLKLPRFEDEKIEFVFIAKNSTKFRVASKIKTNYSLGRENPYIIRLDKVGTMGEEQDFEYTKENYLKVCELCKKLFLGENDVETK